MSYLEEYIQQCLLEQGTIAYGEPPIIYNPHSILLECNSLKEDFEIEPNMELAYFHRDFDNTVDGAAWIIENDNIFKFSVITDDKASDFVFENLVRDCMDEFEKTKIINNKLRLEITVKDEETENFLSEVYGLVVLKQLNDISIMGLGS